MFGISLSLIEASLRPRFALPNGVIPLEDVAPELRLPLLDGVTSLADVAPEPRSTPLFDDLLLLKTLRASLITPSTMSTCFITI